MISFFTVPRGFQGPFETIQHNAIGSVLHLHPHCQLTLLGNDQGVKEVAGLHGCYYVSEVKCNAHGTPLLDNVFEQIQRTSSCDVLCYFNADIIFTESLEPIMEKITFKKFLLIGRRWNLDLNERINFADDNWKTGLLDCLKTGGKSYTSAGIDYFVFNKGLYREIPAFAIGRSLWDNWLIYKAFREGAQVIDITSVVTVVHQNHDYPSSLMDATKKGPWRGEEAKHNLELAGDLDYCFTIDDATWQLENDGLKEVKPTLRRLARRLTTSLVLHEEERQWSWLIKPILRLRLIVRRTVRFLREVVQGCVTRRK